MTKANEGAVTRCREDIANLDVAIGDNDTVNEEFDQRPSLLEGRLVQSSAYLGAERVQRLSDRAQGDVLVRRGVELALLDSAELSCRRSELVVACAEGREVEHSRQIGVE